ncbi:MAG: TA system VapC family ribonuclease toxin [Pseudomonadota bacterium]|jgi:toxin-antitoxin system PIN domain toxin
MIAVDTNVMVYAHRAESSFHDRARQRINELASSRAAWAIPWPCVHEFYAVVTNDRAFKPASTIAQASAQISDWFASPSLVLLHEGPKHWAALRELLASGRVVAGRVHDARIAAICIDHGVREFWTADRDFNRFPSLTVRNPLVG